MPTSIKQAIRKWEEATGTKAAESKEIKLIGQSDLQNKKDQVFHYLYHIKFHILFTGCFTTKCIL